MLRNIFNNTNGGVSDENYWLLAIEKSRIKTPGINNKHQQQTLAPHLDLIFANIKWTNCSFKNLDTVKLFIFEILAGVLR